MAASNERAAARKARTRAASPKSESVPNGAPPEMPAEAQQPDALLLVKQPTPDGGLQIVPQLIGNMQITEAQTVCEIGLRTIRQQLGLEERK